MSMFGLTLWNLSQTVLLKSWFINWNFPWVLHRKDLRNLSVWSILIPQGEMNYPWRERLSNWNNWWLKIFCLGLNFLCTLPVVEVTKIALPGVLVVKNLPASAGRHRRRQSGRSPGGGHGNPFQCSCLENRMDRGAWQAAVHRVAQSWTWLNWLKNALKNTF